MHPFAPQPIDHIIATAQPQSAAYVLAPADLTYLYKGSARNLPERLKNHRAGLVSRTKNHRPLVVVHFEYFDTYTEAKQRELYFKSGAGREWIKRRLFSGQTGQTVPPTGAARPTADPP